MSSPVVIRYPLTFKRTVGRRPWDGRLVPVTIVRRSRRPLVTIGTETLSIAAWGRRWGVSRTRARQRIHVAAGLCEACNETRVTARHCDQHRRAWNARLG